MYPTDRLEVRVNLFSLADFRSHGAAVECSALVLFWSIRMLLALKWWIVEGKKVGKGQRLDLDLGGCCLQLLKGRIVGSEWSNQSVPKFRVCSAAMMELYWTTQYLCRIKFIYIAIVSNLLTEITQKSRGHGQIEYTLWSFAEYNDARLMSSLVERIHIHIRTIYSNNIKSTYCVCWKLNVPMSRLS